MFLTGAHGIRQLLVGNNEGMYAKLEAFLVFLSRPLLFMCELRHHPPYTYISFVATVQRVLVGGPHLGQL